MQKIKIKGDDLLGQESPGATFRRGDSRSVGSRMTWVLYNPSSFIMFVPKSFWFSSPSQILYSALSSGTKHNASASRWLLSSPYLAGSQTWVFSTTRGRRLTLGGQPLPLIQWAKCGKWDHLRVNPGFGVFLFILFSWLGLHLC